MAHQRKIVLLAVGIPFATTALLAAIGSMRVSRIVKVTRSTCADRDVMWDLWANVPERVDWDKGLEYININGPFEEGASGTVKVEGQKPIRYTIVAVDPKNSYTDRFQSLLWTHTDWHHRIEPNSAGCYDVTWELTAQGPLSILLLPVLKRVFGKEVPLAVAEFVKLAEISR